MYERKITEDLDCGIYVAMKVFGSKWKPCIIDSIERGNNRPSMMHRDIVMATPRVIDMQLRELERFDVVEKKVSLGFPLKAEYSLTDLGKSILPILAQMEEWGKLNMDFVKAVSGKIAGEKLAS